MEVAPRYRLLTLLTLFTLLTLLTLFDTVRHCSTLFNTVDMKYNE